MIHKRLSHLRPRYIPRTRAFQLTRAFSADITLYGARVLSSAVRSPGVSLPLLGLGCLFLVSILLPHLAPHDPFRISADSALLPPFWVQGGRLSFFLGTDELGRDLLSRLMFGARQTISYALGASVLSAVGGTVIGMFAAFFGGFWERVILRLNDLLFIFPGILIAMIVAVLSGGGVKSVILAVGIIHMSIFVRQARIAIKIELKKPYIDGTKLLGASAFRILFIHALPNILPLLILQLSLVFSSAILEVSVLGFFGLGAQPPQPEWGAMLSRLQNTGLSYWWLLVFPGLMIFLSVLFVNYSCLSARRQDSLKRE